VKILPSHEFSYRNEEKFQAKQWEGMRPGRAFQSHGANERPNRVIHTENEMVLQILAIQQRPKLLLLLLGIALLVHDERDQKQRGHEDAPGRSRQSLAFDIHRHPARRPCITDTTENQQKPCTKRVELYRLVNFLLFVYERQPAGAYRVICVTAVYQLFLGLTLKVELLLCVLV